MKIARIPLEPFSQFHFGEFKPDVNIALSTTSEFAHSDTLFSALINSYSKKYGKKTEDFINKFISDKIFLSSLFYYLKKDDNIVYLFKKPVFLDLYSLRDQQHKKRNRISFISKKVWETGLNPSIWIDENGKEGEGYKIIQNGEILLTREEFDILGFEENNKYTVFDKLDLPKSPVRKMDSKQSIFYQSNIVIGNIKDVEIGFYFMYNDFHDNENEKMLKNAVNIMAFTGIGGESSNTGRTMNIPVYEKMDFEIINSQKYHEEYVNLSMIIPKDKFELDNILYFKTIMRGGATHTGDNPYKVVRMIQEGALLGNNDLSGRIVKLGFDRHNRIVWRYGKAFIIPVKINKIN